MVIGDDFIYIFSLRDQSYGRTIDEKPIPADAYHTSIGASYYVIRKTHFDGTFHLRRRSTVRFFDRETGGFNGYFFF